MPSRIESLRAQARLQLEAPLPDNADLLDLQERAADYVRKAKQRDPSEPNELVMTVVDAIARFYFGHIIRQQQRRAIKSDLSGKP
jgi:hypothetical protein